MSKDWEKEFGDNFTLYSYNEQELGEDAFDPCNAKVLDFIRETIKSERKALLEEIDNWLDSQVDGWETQALSLVWEDKLKQLEGEAEND